MEKVSHPVLVMTLAVLIMLLDVSAGRVPKPRILLNNNMALTPPMGWNSWNSFGCDVSEQIIRETADAMISTGLHDHGYKYINLDDCWGEQNRDSNGKLVPKKSAFPNGMKAVADYLHSKGLKLGIYSDAGWQTCSQKMPGSLDNEELDAKTFAEWGIDYLKYGNCNNNKRKLTDSYPPMTRALRNSGRDIFFSLSVGGEGHPSTWGAYVANSWRTGGSMNGYWDSMVQTADTNEQYASYARPGSWNDPDMLVVGNGKMSKNEEIVHFSLWAISKAPLLLSVDLRSLSQETLDIITNKEVIAVNQDTYGVQGRKVMVETRNSNGIEPKEYIREVWATPISDYRLAVILLNRGAETTDITATWEHLGLPLETLVEARDVWDHVTLPQRFAGSLTMTVESHACKMYILKPIG